MSSRPAAYLVALIVLLAGSAHAMGVHITDPWPDASSVTGVRHETVQFPSSSPFAPDDSAHAPQSTTTAELYMPMDAPPNHTTPAVVMLHGAAGMVAERGATYGPQLAAMGVAVLVIDTYGSRRDMATGFIGRVLHITETMFVADAYAGLRYLATIPMIDPNHVVLTGFSYGGMATMYSLYAEMADRFAPPGLRFAGHVSFYGPCVARFDDSRTTGAPLLMLYGQGDELIRPDRCNQIANDFRAGGSQVNVISYPGAVHQWDGGMPHMMIGRNLSGCSFRVSRNGAITDEHTGLPMTGVLTREIILGLCVPDRPYPIGADAKVRAQSNRDFGAFLRRVFNAPAAG
jgi:dienelactone hydrolase